MTRKEQERLDQLGWDNLQIIQNPSWFCFSLDAILLAAFAQISPQDKVMDLGTGTGVIPLLLSYREKNARIQGLELQPEVLSMAQRSIALNHKEAQITLYQGDLCTASALFGKGQYDLVVCNPPYDKKNCGRPGKNKQREISRKEIFCTLEDVIRESALLLNAQGRLALVHRPARLAEIFHLCITHQLQVKRLRLVYPRYHREPNMVLLEAVKQGKGDLQVLPPLFIYESETQYSEEMQSIFAGHIQG